jgi:protein SCO1
MRTITMRTIPLRVLLTTAFLLAAWAMAQAAPPGPPPLPADSVYQLDAPLIDQDGRRLKLGDQRGTPQVVVMFYTSCGALCPTLIDTLLDLDHQLTPTERERLGVLLISLDPQRDDPAALKATADKRSLDTRRWTLAQPRSADVRAIAGLLGVRYRLLANGEVNHTGVVVLLDADGRVVARSDKTGGPVETPFLNQVRAVLARAAVGIKPPPFPVGASSAPSTPASPAARP